MRFLLIEDDDIAARYLQQGLTSLGYELDLAPDGEQGLAMAHSTPYDLWIVDVMLPKLDGLALLKILREEGNSTPALILSARGTVEDRVSGLNAGGDDYIVKPYALAEVQARIEALLRRSRTADSAHETALEVADLHLDLINRTVTRAGKEISLKPREFRLLQYLMRHAGQLVTRSMLLEQVWDLSFDPHTNLVDVHISGLRAKIDKSFETPLLHTVRGEGYVFGANK
jgi:two-component system OmpR family response regulator